MEILVVGVGYGPTDRLRSAKEEIIQQIHRVGDVDVLGVVNVTAQKRAPRLVGTLVNPARDEFNLVLRQGDAAKWHSLAVLWGLTGYLVKEGTVS